MSSSWVRPYRAPFIADGQTMDMYPIGAECSRGRGGFSREILQSRPPLIDLHRRAPARPFVEIMPHCWQSPRHSSLHTTRAGVARTIASRANPDKSTTMSSTKSLRSASSHPSFEVGTNSCSSALNLSTTSRRQRAQGPYTVTAAITFIRKPPATRSTMRSTPSAARTSYRSPPSTIGAILSGNVRSERSPPLRARSFRSTWRLADVMAYRWRSGLLRDYRCGPAKKRTCYSETISPPRVCRRSRPRCTAARNLSRLVSKVFRISSA